MRREFSREDVPLRFEFDRAELVALRLEVRPKALPDVEEWLGVDNIRGESGTLIAEASMPQDDLLLSKLLSFGDGIRVLAPEAVAEDLAARARALAEQYR